ncbi:MAG: hypothetical protein LBT38_04995, partial [Deltaproteobacteria bacterium]|nr:hypothetical protein [Deltaproteobacteria bacterium]
HSLVYELYANGRLTEEAMGAHPLKNILTSSIQDSLEEPRLFSRAIEIIPGDNFFICSDGVWETARRSELEAWAALGAEEGSRQLATFLLKRATDNFTFIWLY